MQEIHKLKAKYNKEQAEKAENVRCRKVDYIQEYDLT